MKIAILTSEYPPFRGGVSTYAYELARAAAADGDEVTVLAPDYHADQRGHDRAMPGLTVRFAGKAATGRTLPDRTRAAWTLLGRERFDIVHAADWPFYIPARLARGRQRRARFLFTVHGSEIVYMGHGKRRAVLGALGFWRRGWVRWIANSRHTRDLLLRTFPQIDPADALTTPLGVSAEWIAGRVDRDAARARFGLASDDLVLVSLGRVVPRKGHAFLADALALLPPERAARLRWWVIGPLLDPEHAALLEAKAAALAVPTVVFGALPVEEVRARVSAADLFCLPGYHHPTGGMEGFGLAFLEAGAYGVPAVATRSGGIPDAVDDGVTGLLVPEQDAPAVAAALERLIADPALRARLGAGAEAKARGATWASVMRQTYAA